MSARRSSLPFSSPTGEQLWLRGLGQTKPNLVAKKLLFICYLRYFMLYDFHSWFACTLRFYSKLSDTFLFELFLSRISKWDSVGGQAWVWRGSSANWDSISLVFAWNPTIYISFLNTTGITLCGWSSEVQCNVTLFIKSFPSTAHQGDLHRHRLCAMNTEE